MNQVKEKLFAEFSPITTEQWMEKITTDLKGADFNKKLVWKTNEGFDVKPFYRAEDIKEFSVANVFPGQFPYIRGTNNNNDWFVRQDITVDNAHEANAKALNILNKGINSIGFIIPAELVDETNITALLNNIHAECVELNFKTCNSKSITLINILNNYFKSQNNDLTKINGSVNIDFIGKILTKGKVKKEWIEVMTDAIKASSELTNLKVIAVNANIFSDAGSFITQELGYALAWGNEIINSLANAGINPNITAAKIKFNFGIGSNYFLEIAKFRAAKWLWAIIVNECEKEYNKVNNNKINPEKTQESAKINIFAKTTDFNLTIYDPYVNLLRTQTEAMSATIAGVNSLLVNTFDKPYKTPDEFSERIARNQQLMLKEECHFDKVTDPSGGSYYIETLTNSIANEAWKLFIETDEIGFYNAALESKIQKNINASADKRFVQIAQRREILLGTNQYPNFNEKLNINTEKNSPNKEICPCGEKPDTEILTINTRRLGEAFETLRMTTEKSGKDIKAFMLTIGNLAMRLARAQFSCNFLASAGYKVIDNLGFETISDGISAARNANADIIVLCSSDDEYATYAPEAFKLINGKEILIIAGAPACTDELKAQGITNFINIRSNVLETLQNLNLKMGI
jgi:methylmalonyl-CoA mutase